MSPGNRDQEVVTQWLQDLTDVVEEVAGPLIPGLKVLGGSLYVAEVGQGVILKLNTIIPAKFELVVQAPVQRESVGYEVRVSGSRIFFILNLKYSFEVKSQFGSQ